MKYRPSHAIVNGRQVDITKYSAETHEMVFDGLQLSLNSEIDVKWE